MTPDILVDKDEYESLKRRVRDLDARVSSLERGRALSKPADIPLQPPPEATGRATDLSEVSKRTADKPRTVETAQDLDLTAVTMSIMMDRDNPATTYDISGKVALEGILRDGRKYRIVLGSTNKPKVSVVGG